MTNCAPALAGVIGWPIGHSRSPRLHGHWLRRYAIDGYYIPIGLPPGELAAGLQAVAKLGFRGVNVTLPHKEAALALADTLSARAREIGAANTLTFAANGEIAADNTDGYGFLESLRQSVPDWRAEAGPALVLGAGGAARGVVSALLSARTGELRIANRTAGRAEKLRAHFGERIVVVSWKEASEATDGVATIVNTTSLGMAGQPPLQISLHAAPRHALVTDIVYQPLVTPFLAAAQARGLRIVDGLGMLLHQAVPGFEAWFGRKPDVDAELRRAVLGS